jgi:hypothetical protein
MPQSIRKCAWVVKQHMLACVARDRIEVDPGTDVMQTTLISGSSWKRWRSGTATIDRRLQRQDRLGYIKDWGLSNHVRAPHIAASSW